MVRKWKLGASGSALLATALVVVACSSTSEDDDDKGSGGTGASGGTGGAGGSTGGKAPATGGMSTTGGAGGAGGTAGSTTGGSAGAASGGAPGAGAGGMAPTGFACTTPTAATCDSIQTWGNFTNGTFGGGLYVYGDITRDTAVTDAFHVTGTVTTYSGFGVYFNSCSSLAAYTGVSFVMTGTSASTAKPNAVRFIVQTNEDEPVDTMNSKGACPGMPGVGCNSPRVESVAPSDMAQPFLFTAFMGGEPVATVTTTQVLGLQWQFDPDTASPAGYAVDFTIDNLTFTGGTAAPVECTAPMGGMGGMGAGGAATGGGPAAGGAPMGGAGGTAGAATGGAPAGGAGAGGAATGGRAAGGMSGGGGAPGGGRGGRGSAGSAGGA
jgi:hypothetical protein